MRETMWIGQLEARYRLPSSRLGERDRLDRVLAAVLQEALERALERVGVPLHEEVCIREVRVPVCVRLSSSDGSLGLAWSLALAEAIRDAIAGRGHDGVVRYGSRAQALIDLATGVASGDLRRAWAWRQVGLGAITEQASPATALAVLLQALFREADRIVPTLGVLAERGDLAPLAARFGPEGWNRLARAALQASGGPLTFLDEPEPLGGILTDCPRDAIRGILRHVLARSTLLAKLDRIAVTSPAVRFALAVLAVIEVEPGAWRRPTADQRWLIEAIAHRIGPLASPEQTDLVAGSPEPEPMSPTELPQPHETPPSSPTEGRDSGRAASSSADREIDDLGWSRTRRTDDDTQWPSPLDRRHRESVGEEDRQRAPDRGQPTTPEDRPLPAPRRRGFTRMGGLLFLIGLLDDLGMPDEAASREPLRRRPFRWVLHQLALRLADVPPDDPAALAFAGLAPGERPPSADLEAPKPVEQGALTRWADRIAGELRRRLGRREATRTALLEEVCRRRAEIVADPGWIEVHLSLDEVSTAIRRSGLDLDPGFVPWLGVALKFFYE